MTTSQKSPATGERADILQILQEQRATLLITVRGIDDDQARQRSTVSDLTLGGLIKHVLHTEKHWVETILEPDENAEFDMEWAMEKYYMRDDETLEGLLAEYTEVALATEAAVAGLDNLDVLIPLPTAPWHPSGSGGRSAAPCSTSSGRPATIPVTPTSSGNPSTAETPPCRWAPTRAWSSDPPGRTDENTSPGSGSGEVFSSCGVFEC